MKLSRIEKKIIKIESKVAALEKKVEMLWKFEHLGGYLIGNRADIIIYETKLAKHNKILELLKEKTKVKE